MNDRIVVYDTRPWDWSIRSNSENFVKKPSFEEKMSIKCLVLCKSYQLVVSITINYYKRIMMEREKHYVN